MNNDGSNRNLNGLSVVYTAQSPMYQDDIGEDGQPLPPPGFWSPSDATDRINACAGRDDLDLWVTLEIKAWMEAHEVIMGDLFHLLSTGYVYEDPTESSISGYFKYKVEGPAPNTNGRTMAALIIPNGGRNLKICTLTWKDGR